MILRHGDCKTDRLVLFFEFFPEESKKNLESKEKEEVLKKIKRTVRLFRQELIIKVKNVVWS